MKMSDTRVEPVDVDNFVVGNKESGLNAPLDFSLPKVLAYMKRTGKSFADLTDSELKQCKGNCSE